MTSKRSLKDIEVKTFVKVSPDPVPVVVKQIEPKSTIFSKTEERISELESILTTELSPELWTKYTREYHALCIKLARIKNEKVTANEYKSDYII